MFRQFLLPVLYSDYSHLHPDDIFYSDYDMPFLFLLQMHPVIQEGMVMQTIMPVTDMVVSGDLARVTDGPAVRLMEMIKIPHI